VSDTAAFALLVVSFATLVTAHVTIAFGLSRRAPWWRAPVAFVVVPLAPYWALRARMRVRAALWGVAALVYLYARARG
jgi:hypothetical protein